MKLVAAITLSLAALAGLSSCVQEGATPSPQAANASNVEIVSVPELSPVRDAAKPPSAGAWIEGSAAGSEWDMYKSAPDAVQRAIVSAAPQLAAVDYAGLSLPAFVTATRSLKLEPAAFDSGKTHADAFAQTSDGGKWALYAWQGPELPQLPDRPLVHRWVYVYALYDITTGKVVRLLPTIRGEVWE